MLHPNSTFVTDATLADLLGVSVRSIQRQAQKAGFPGAIRIGRCRRWNLARVLSHLQPPCQDEQVPANARQ